MSEAPEPDPEAPANPARRDSWSLRAIVQEVSGHSLEEYQDPARTPHPYLRVKPPHGADGPVGVPSRASDAHPAEVPERPDPIGRFYPPLVGAIGRRTHGPAEEHHEETLRQLAGEEGPSSPGGPSSPSRRPERVYLHYLLLHLDRLSDHALRYLARAVHEEREHRAQERRGRGGPPPGP